MDIKITGCSTCPLCHSDGQGYWECKHPNNEEVPIITYDVHGKLKTPDECPLKEDTITISY